MIGPTESNELFRLLDGLPLAITQAAAYIQQTGISFTRYTEFYKTQWKELMQSEGNMLQEYDNRSVWTTWTISYHAVRSNNEAAANLLLLWSHLENKDLWFGLLATASKQNIVAANLISLQLHEIGSNELKFNEAIRLLRNYSLIEEMEDLTAYTMHPVVHNWALHIQGEEQRVELAELAVMIVGLAVPHDLEKEYWILQRRLLSHAQCCSRWILGDAGGIPDQRASTQCETDAEREEVEVLPLAIHEIGNLFVDQGKLVEAEQMYQHVLKGPRGY